jgi:malonyl-CoA O-methyltransferase
VFDTGQILKGLLALEERTGGYEAALRKGCDWLVGRVGPDGRMTTPDTSQWGLPGGRRVPEAIHLYALPPLIGAGRRFDEPRYVEAARRVLDYYAGQPDTGRFDTLAHFHAYVAEALADLGETERSAKAMAPVAALQRRNGSIPAYPDGAGCARPRCSSTPRPGARSATPFEPTAPSPMG